MKRFIILFCTVLASTVLCSAAMSSSRVRLEARFLTDKMAYELKLSKAQYHDVYDINYDCIANIGSLMDNVLRGEEWALNRYYDCLDIRNDDLHWVLNRSQYGHFIQAAHFFRPVYVSGGRWNFRIYLTYTNHKHFYYPCPPHYKTYCGAHARPHHNHVSYYKGRYHHAFYAGNFRIRDGKHYHSSRRSDFGSIRLRPGSSKAPDRKAPSRPKPKPEKAPVKVIRPKKDKDKAPAHRPSREPSRKEQNDRASSNSIRKRA